MDLLNFINTVPQLDQPKMQTISQNALRGTTTKRRRLRRHPVWAYFGDIAEKVVGCNMCSFTTISAFSTNLKMHLKSHHKREYIIVMEQEVAQLAKETVHEPIEANKMKRRRKTVHELREAIDKCKQSIERDGKNMPKFAQK
jgi:hypothetical protein